MHDTGKIGVMATSILGTTGLMDSDRYPSKSDCCICNYLLGWLQTRPSWSYQMGESFFVNAIILLFILYLFFLQLSWSGKTFFSPGLQLAWMVIAFTSLPLVLTGRDSWIHIPLICWCKTQTPAGYIHEEEWVEDTLGVHLPKGLPCLISIQLQLTFLKVPCNLKPSAVRGQAIPRHLVEAWTLVWTWPSYLCGKCPNQCCVHKRSFWYRIRSHFSQIFDRLEK